MNIRCNGVCFTFQFTLHNVNYRKKEEFSNVSIKRNFCIFVVTLTNLIMRYFNTKFLEDANTFIFKLPSKAREKLIYNIDLAEQTNDPRLFKKLQNDIWEFRIRYLGQQIRLLAFWDKTDKQSTLVIATHGFIKKVDKIPDNEIKRASKLRTQYFKTYK